MPIYCFKCPECDYQEEVQLLMGAADSYRCSNCGRPAERDRTKEIRGTPAPQPLMPPVPVDREKTLDQQVRDGDFKLYDDARSRGLLP